MFKSSLIVFLCSASILWSQGFDWEYSARLPFRSPTIFAGPVFSFSNVAHTTDIRVLEEVHALEPAFTCATYSKGDGRALSFGAQAEYWKWGSTALWASLQYETLQADFSADSPPSTLNDGNIFQTGYLLSTTIHYLRVEVIAKEKVLSNAHLWIGGGLTAEFSMGVKSTLRERIISPSGATFPGTNLQEKILSENDIAGVRSVVLNPTLLMGYDVDMGRGCYTSPALSVGLPLMNFSQQTEWKILSLGFHVSVVFGINSD